MLATDSLIPPLPVEDDAVRTPDPLAAYWNAMRPAPAALANEGVRSTAVPDLVGAVRYLVTMIKQLPLQPLLAALVVAFMLGAIPMLLTAIYSAVRALANWYRHAFPSRPFADHPTVFHQQVGPSATAPNSDPSVNLTHLNELINQPELP
jgi:hypothetical protein